MRDVTVALRSLNGATPESILEVHTALIDRLGRKFVANKLWPHKDIGSATRYLSDCLNPNREHCIGVERSHQLKKLAAERGIHSAFEWEAIDLGYSAPVYIEVDPIKAELRRRLDDAERTVAELRNQRTETLSVLTR